MRIFLTPIRGLHSIVSKWDNYDERHLQCMYFWREPANSEHLYCEQLNVRNSVGLPHSCSLHRSLLSLRNQYCLLPRMDWNTVDQFSWTFWLDLDNLSKKSLYRHAWLSAVCPSRRCTHPQKAPSFFLGRKKMYWGSLWNLESCLSSQDLPYSQEEGVTLRG